MSSSMGKPSPACSVCADPFFLQVASPLEVKAFVASGSDVYELSISLPEPGQVETGKEGVLIPQARDVSAPWHCLCMVLAVCWLAYPSSLGSPCMPAAHAALRVATQVLWACPCSMAAALRTGLDHYSTLQALLCTCAMPPRTCSCDAGVRDQVG